MQCPNCGFEVPNTALFCTNCGVLIKLACPECGADPEVGARFCSQCGYRFPDSISPSKSQSDQEIDQLHKPSFQIPPLQTDPYERRMVTILFADIAQYSTLSEKLDPEHLLEIMAEAYPCLLEPIQKHSGTVVQVMGDGVLAYFGVPLAQEDDPECAILAGLEIVARIQTYAKKLRKENVVDHFHVRVGINTGLVVVGEMNPEKHLEYIALGDAVNLAARLQQNAPIDQVLISHRTYQQVQGLFDVERQAPLTVKGRQGVELTYLVKGRKPARQRLRKRGLEGIETAMIGREPEIAALQNDYTDAIQGGETALVLITGEAGIGKTRLVDEFASWVISQSTTPILFRGRAIASTQSVPFGVLRNLFARSFGILETDSSAQALDKFRIGTHNTIDTEQADLIGQLVGFDFKISPSVSQLLGNASFNNLATLYLGAYIRKLAERPLLILLEDLHWMDDRTLDFIIELVANLALEGDARMMIIGTARHRFLERRPTWGEGIPGFTRLELRKLSHFRSRALIDEMLYRAEDIPEGLYDCVVDESGGNPFFIEEMIKMLIEEGVIETEDDPWRIKLDKLADIPMPSTLTGILQARLDALPPAEKLILQRAAVIGRTFWDDPVRLLTEDEGEAGQVNAHLTALRERGLIFHREHSSIAGSQEYLFKHALLCDAAYETVLLKHRQKYHHQVAKWVEENAADRLNEHLALIASHYFAGGQPELAADWFIRAGERSLSQCSMPEAKDLFEQALRLIPPEDIRRLWRATLGHDEAVGTLGELDARHADDWTLLNLAQQIEGDSLLAEAYFRIGSQAYTEGNNQASLLALNQAIQAAERTDDHALQALILPMQVSLFTLEGDLHKAGLLVERARALAEGTGDANILARALNNLTPYYQAIGDLSKSVQLMHHQVEINQAQGNRLGEAIGSLNLGYIYISLGHFETGHKLLERALTNSLRLGARSCVAYALLNLGLAEWRLGQPEVAIQTLQRSLGELEAIGDQRGLASRHFYLGLAHEMANELPTAYEQFSTALQAFKLLEASSQMVEAQAGLARIAHQNGDFKQAGEIAHQIINYLDQAGPQGLELPILVYLSCAKIFQTLGETSLLQHTLEIGRQEIQDRLEKISEVDWQEIFLKAIPENREWMAFKEDGQ